MCQGFKSEELAVYIDYGLIVDTHVLYVFSCLCTFS